jgi:hypothetical protein
MKLTNRLTAFLGISTSFICGAAAASAHALVAPRIPVHHAIRVFSPLVANKSLSNSTVHQLLLQALSRKRFNILPKSIFSPGYPLSGAQHALVSEIKTIAAKSIYTTEANLGPILSGQTYSTVFVSAGFGGGTTLTPQPPEIDEFGASNPLNTGGGGSPMVFNNLSPIFNFGSVQKTVSGTILHIPSGTLAVGRPESQAVRAFDNLFGSVAKQGVAAGNFLKTHPIGGELFGVYYYPTTYYPVSYQLLAFGNSPLNNPAITSVQYQQFGSYLQFANKVRVYISNGQFLSTYYFATSPGSKVFQAQAYNFDVFGANPLNNFATAKPLGPNYPFTVPYFLH